MVGHSVSLQYLCFAGAMISCNGWLDVLIYSTTRHIIIFGSDITAADTGINTFAFMGTAGSQMGNTTVIESTLNSRKRMSKNGKGGWAFLSLTSRFGGAGREDDERPVSEGNAVALRGLGQIQAETTTVVVREDGEHEPPRKFRNKGNTSGSATSRPASVRSMV